MSSEVLSNIKSQIVRDFEKQFDDYFWEFARSFHEESDALCSGSCGYNEDGDENYEPEIMFDFLKSIVPVFKGKQFKYNGYCDMYFNYSFDQDTNLSDGLYVKENDKFEFLADLKIND